MGLVSGRQPGAGDERAEPRAAAALVARRLAARVRAPQREGASSTSGSRPASGGAARLDRPNARQPAWSPDGRLIAYSVERHAVAERRERSEPARPHAPRSFRWATTNRRSRPTGKSLAFRAPPRRALRRARDRGRRNRRGAAFDERRRARDVARLVAGRPLRSTFSSSRGGHAQRLEARCPIGAPRSASRPA